jgi:uncharacterized protein (TIGR00297 family)
MLLYHFTGNEAFLAAFLGSIAAANADSWASEIGGLSRSSPVMITTFQPIEKGISGGVTWMGTWGGVAGSLFIVLAAAGTWQAFSDYPVDLPMIAASFIAGVAGFIFDSWVGAVFQALYRNNVADNLTEAAHAENHLVKGIPLVNNDFVNLISTSFAAVFAGIGYLCLK